MPNFVAESTVQSWPKWAQRHVVLGLDLQGGSHILLEVDSNAVRKEKVETLRDDVRRVLRDAKVGYTGLIARGDTVEVRIREGADFQTGAAPSCANYRSRSAACWAAPASASVDVVDAGGGLIRLTVTDAAMIERIRQSVEQSIQIVERRVNELGTVEPLIQRQGVDRILVQVPGLQDPSAPEGLCSANRETDLPPGRHLRQPAGRAAGPRAARFRGALRRQERSKSAGVGAEADHGLGRRSDRRAAGLRPAHQRADRVVPLQHLGRARASPR